MKHTEMIMVIEAHSEGKTIQVAYSDHGGWVDASDPSFNFDSCNYRVKPTPIYATLKGQYPAQTDPGSGEWVDRKALESALTMLSSRTLSNDELRMYDALKEVVIS